MAPAPPGVARRRRTAALLLCAVVLLCVVVASLAIGVRPVPWDQVVQALRAPDPQNVDHLAVLARAPRTVLAAAVGAALGLAGAVMQGVTRNPLADPGILGINSGASVAVVVAISVLGIRNVGGYLVFAFAGALGAAVLVSAVASAGRDGATPVKLALAGAAVSAGLTSVIAAVLIASDETLDTFRFWQVGGVGGRDLSTVGPVLPFLALGAVLAIATGRGLNAMAMGDDVARGLGHDVTRSRVLAAAAVALLCGAATAAAGPIGFVGLTVPHIARLAVGSDYRWVLPFAAVLGAVLLTGADVVGRVIARPGELQVGILTAVLGAPVFIALVRRRRTVGL